MEILSQRTCEHIMGLGSNPGEDMVVCQCVVPLRHEGTLNSRKSSREVGGRRRYGRPLTISRVFSLKTVVERSRIILSPCNNPF
ncbi:hypothetical protein TNCV_1418271 [Trichonephila clavipes]|nr:hypothetical protein TNCV_1418271 [Trichonephila clavipes]